MVNEPIGYIMELREVGKCDRSYFMCSEPCFREIRGTFAAQRFDSVLFHLQMKQKPVGTSGIAESLQGGDVGAGQRHTVFGEVEHFAMPFEDVE